MREALTRISYLSREHEDWTALEDFVLITSLGLTPIKEIARALERSVGACYNRASRLHITQKRNWRLAEMQARWGGCSAEAESVGVGELGVDN